MTDSKLAIGVKSCGGGITEQSAVWMYMNERYALKRRGCSYSLLRCTCFKLQFTPCVNLNWDAPARVEKFGISDE